MPDPSLPDPLNAPDADLAALCSQLGIDAQYQDAWGRTTQVSPATQRVLCAAMGFAADDPAQAQAALARLQARQAGPGMPSALVLPATEAALVCGLRLPVALLGGAMRWQLTLEDGQVRRGVSVAREASQVPPYPAADGEAHWVDALLDLPAGLPIGHHQLRLVPAEPAQGGAGPQGMTLGLILCPERCHPVAGRMWGPTVQVYALRSPGNWGIGDFSDLRRLVDVAARAGADFVGINPLHALFPHAPEQASPYSPSSRLWLNIWTLDLEDVPDFDECPEVQALCNTAAWQQRLAGLRALPSVDYAGVAAVKRPVMALMYASFRARHLGRRTRRGQAFRTFQARHGRALRVHALHEALQAHFHAQDAAVWGWPAWPAAYQAVDSAPVDAFARVHEEAVEFYEYLQWQADLQLQAVQSQARAQGMRVGLYGDLAVGVHPGGSETWSQPGLYAPGVHVGAPPDELSPTGQDWGFAPMLPWQLQRSGYAGFIAVLQAAMRPVGALRIDHVMGLMRLFWVAPHPTQLRGAYVQAPFEALMRLVCLESQRHGCSVIGEDLGIVPPEVSQAMQQHGLLSYKPLYFEQHWHEGRFKAPADWAADALATVSTHDLPTLCGYWRGFDVQLRELLGLYPEPGLQEGHSRRRERERGALLAALAEQGLLHEGLTTDPGCVQAPDPRLTLAVHRYLASTPCALAAVSLADVLDVVEPANLPGTTEQRYPNWRHKLPLDLPDLAADARWLRTAEALAEARPAVRPVAPPEPRDEATPHRFDPRRAAIPRATYRLQFHAGFRFIDAQALLPYLQRLGISHVYASPFLTARPGSQHGYDVIDHAALNPELGTPAEFEAFCLALCAHGLQLLVDIVPNHMGVLGADNPWWLDVLENGRASAYAEHFDIDWEGAAPDWQGKVLVPVLGAQYGEVLESGELQLTLEAERGEFCLRYHAHRLPIDPRDYAALMGEPAHEDDPQDDTPLAAQWQALRDRFAALPARDADSTSTDDATTWQAQCQRRQQAVPVLKAALAALWRQSAALREHTAAQLRRLNGRVGEPASVDALDALLGRQAYRLASWQVASDDINYRRFFDVNELAALRTEDPAVFEATHALVWPWLQQGCVSGLRIDHPDGLADPQQYFERLQARHAELRGPQADGRAASLYLVVEKILADDEALPAAWPVHGGTGYRFGHLSSQVLVDSTQEARLSRVYRSFSGEARSFDDILHEAKQQIIGRAFSADLAMLTRQLHHISQRDRHTRDFTRNALREAIAALAAGFGVYRTYVRAQGPTRTDWAVLDQALQRAMQRQPLEDHSVLRFVREVILGAPAEPDAALRVQKLAFVTRFQQFTAPVMAKAMEDTSFYRYLRLASLNEVGGDPATFGLTVDDYHAAVQRIAQQHPHGLLSSSTHDSKRSEDLRTRIHVLSELPAHWRWARARWRALNLPAKTRVDGELAPSANDEYLLYQSLLGLWPFEAPDASARDTLADRLEAYLRKAAREAKVHTRWTRPHAGYEQALQRFVRHLVCSAEAAAFRDDFTALQARVAVFGAWNSLSMLLLKLTSPGVPDTYQGCEDWAFNLVDPDNRRPVDHARLAGLLAQVTLLAGNDAVADLARHLPDGRLKLYLTWCGLQLRRSHANALQLGSYQPLEVLGPARRHVVAFARQHEQEVVITLASRLTCTLCDGEPDRLLQPAERWAGTRVLLPAHLGPGPWHEALTQRPLPPPRGRELDLATAFATLPLAVLVTGVDQAG